MWPCTSGEIRTHTFRGLNPMPLPVGLRMHITPAGLEPCIARLKVSYPGHLDEGAMFVPGGTARGGSLRTNRKSLPWVTRQAEKTLWSRTDQFFRLMSAVFFPHETDPRSRYRDSKSSYENNDIILQFIVFSFLCPFDALIISRGL